MKAIPTILRDHGIILPVLGQGTWNMGESPARAGAEIRALQAGIALGMTLIDTAEMYAGGGAEKVVGRAIAGRRDEVFLVSKVLPQNASRRGTAAACEASLKRLGTERIDLYLLHWRGDYPLWETVEALQALVAQGKIAAWGVSNFDTDDITELLREDYGRECQTNQVLYNLSRRGIEFDLLPQAEELGMPVMAYSPIEQGRILDHPALAQVARQHGVNAAQIALAWVLRRPGIIAIPKASDEAHVIQNRACLDIDLTPDDLQALDAAFAPPRRKQRLAML